MLNRVSAFKTSFVSSLIKKQFSIKIPTSINFVHLSEILKIPSQNLIKKYESLFEESILEPFGRVPQENLELFLLESEVDYELDEGEMKLVPRPIIVTIMGHVDHGKTSLLDSFRNSRIVDSEYGQITQSIGAFTVLTKNKNTVTFIDTPGHQAFSNMRERGIEPSDLIILVVSAVEGVQEQTTEVITLAQKANVPIIVALNKVDRPEYDWESSLDNLLTAGLNIAPRGGSIPVVPISALKKINLDLLENEIDKVAKQLNLMGDISSNAQGFVIESRVNALKSGSIVSASIIVESGVLRLGNAFVCGETFGRVRTITNDRGESIESALPGNAVEISGFKDSPLSGTTLVVMDIKQADALATDRGKEKEKLSIAQKKIEGVKGLKLAKMKNKKERRMIMNVGNKVLLKEKIDQVLEGENKLAIEEISRIKEVYLNKNDNLSNLIIKADTEGILETIFDELSEYYDEDYIKKYLVDFSVGLLSETDFKVAF